MDVSIAFVDAKAIVKYFYILIVIYRLAVQVDRDGIDSSWSRHIQVHSTVDVFPHAGIVRCMHQSHLHTADRKLFQTNYLCTQSIYVPTPAAIC